jgi:hypothetical protein
VAEKRVPSGLFCSRCADRRGWRRGSAIVHSSAAGRCVAVATFIQARSRKTAAQRMANRSIFNRSIGHMRGLWWPRIATARLAALGRSEKSSAFGRRTPWDLSGRVISPGIRGRACRLGTTFILPDRSARIASFCLLLHKKRSCKRGADAFGAPRASRARSRANDPGQWQSGLFPSSCS